MLLVCNEMGDAVPMLFNPPFRTYSTPSCVLLFSAYNTASLAANSGPYCEAAALIVSLSPNLLVVVHGNACS